MASAKLANMTVRNSHTVTDQANTLGLLMASTAVMTVPTRTTNITGLRTWTRGSSLSNDDLYAGATTVQSKMARLAGRWPAGGSELGVPGPGWVMVSIRRGLRG